MSSSPRNRKAGAKDAPSSSISEYKDIAAQWAKAKAEKEAADAKAAREGLPTERETAQMLERNREQQNTIRQKGFERRWWWTVGFWTWLLFVHIVGIWLFTSGFLLTRFVLEDKSNCTAPPIGSHHAHLSVDKGCWHPKTFDRAIVVVIDALRYDFTVPQDPDTAQVFHNAFPFMYDTAVKSPQNAFLRPFIADPPTATMQRLKGMTTGTLPTFIDAGGNFGGEAIDEDNILLQLKDNGKKIAQIGDDTWWGLFPGYFEPNISKAYDSFNVWDLHSVDNGVIDNIFPLFDKSRKGEWDLLIGHCLGVDHAGHRYGPDHPAMQSKLQQMDEFVRRLVDSVDDDTLLIVMGDHGMDSKGDHGGESDDEIEAALWMYSKRPIFGRTAPEYKMPPATAKIRPVGQIDFVPTLSLLLGLPIPYNNLGRPIEEAFAGPMGNDWANLAAVSRMTSAGIERYLNSYFAARGITPASDEDSPSALWAAANAHGLVGRDLYAALTTFQERTLSVFKDLWARFDVPRMVMGVFVMAIGVLVLVMYASGDNEEFVVKNDAELDYAEKKLEAAGFDGDETHPEEHFHRDLLRWTQDARVLFVMGSLIAASVYRGQPMDGLAALVVTLMITSVGTALHDADKTLFNLIPSTFWGWLSVVFTLSHSIGFASNSYTIWEDSILLFFVATFGVAALISSFRIEKKVERTMAVYHSVVFILLARVASYSKMCREEQMPFCTSTYYASSTSSTSASWQLAIPFLVFSTLPSIIKAFLTPTKSYDGLSPTWIGYVFRASLLLVAGYWLIDTADNAGWLADKLPNAALKTVGVYLAQTILAIAVVAGTTAFIWAPPSVSIVSAASTTGQPRIVIMGYANALGSRYLLLPINLLIACLLLTKPMGTGALGIMLWQVLCLVEMTDLNNLRAETIGPVMLAILGNFYFFKTGHQATLSSIQWDTAFIPLFKVRYPWTPLVVAANTFAGQLLAAACVPLLTLWKVGPKQRGVLEGVARGMGVFVAYFAVEALATMSWAGWLRRHLMLFRIFCPRFMMAAVLLVFVDIVVLVVALCGVRSNMLAVSEVFGWAE
ncbi:mannose-ethanolamine phosphotransferase gpi13 [Lecanicillium sp. MT-2017a]|nr:mannose-ethanolamine phosphotransferase gpi13 [Lecanicillium sp. MT-2017a]